MLYYDEECVCVRRIKDLSLVWKGLTDSRGDDSSGYFNVVHSKLVNILHSTKNTLIVQCPNQKKMLFKKHLPNYNSEFFRKEDANKRAIFTTQSDSKNFCTKVYDFRKGFREPERAFVLPLNQINYFDQFMIAPDNETVGFMIDSHFIAFKQDQIRVNEGLNAFREF